MSGSHEAVSLRRVVCRYIDTGGGLFLASLACSSKLIMTLVRVQAEWDRVITSLQRKLRRRFLVVFGHYNKEKRTVVFHVGWSSAEGEEGNGYVKAHQIGCSNGI
ncbi:hypothetical protein [Paenibacillus pini]|uniref:hypothetical protein n=1 Tax=Paenibacillus pini TaxID=669461 RepID=UPI000566F963|nr:hypothetical protein [Paenibacillus pini]